MMRVNAKILVGLGVIVAGAGLVATTAYAYGWCCQAPLSAPALQRQDVSPQQQDQIVAAQRRFAESLRPLHQKWLDKRAGLDAYIASDDSTLAGVKQRLQEIRALEAQIEDLRTAAATEAQKLLPQATPVIPGGAGSPYMNGGYCDDWGWRAWLGLRQGDPGTMTPGGPWRDGGYGWCW